jgi:predicted AAA+ superfamily ATPase
MQTAILEKLITDWNPHFEDVGQGRWKGTVTRERYLETLKKLMDIRHTVILTGVRRAGKSVLMQQLAGWLIEERKVLPTNVVYLFLEDIQVSQYLKLGADLLESLYTYYLERYNPSGRVYLLLDEIQGVKDFNRWIASRYERKEEIKFIISGSRRSLIEAENATVLTGRNVQIDVYPFNFYEYLLVHNVEVRGKSDTQSIWSLNNSRQIPILHYLGRYLYEGGYPEIVLAKNETAKRAIAAGYYRDGVTRDVLIPNNLRNARDIEVLGLQILADFTKTHTLSSLSKPNKLSVDTVKNYLEYFTKAYLFFESTYFSYKTKETQDIQRPRKIYVVDNGLRNFNIPQLRPDLGQCVENAAFMELKKNNAAVSYWKGKQEIDFAVLNPNLSLVNVSYCDQPHEREVAGLLEGLREFKLDKGTILTKNYFTKKRIEGKTIEFIPLWVWLISNGRMFFKERSAGQVQRV